MSVETRTSEDVAIVTPKGMLLGGKETEELDRAIQSLVEGGNRKLLIDLGKTTYMNSSAIAALLRWLVSYKNRGGEIRLCRLDTKIKQVFVLTKLVLVFPDHDSEEEAIAAFRVSSPAAPRPTA
jgi:anti-sigma B factor antagonist